MAADPPPRQRRPAGQSAAERAAGAAAAAAAAQPSSARKILIMNPLNVPLQPWDQFFAEFKKPKNFAERVQSNFKEYAGNYYTIMCVFYLVSNLQCLILVAGAEIYLQYENFPLADRQRYEYYYSRAAAILAVYSWSNGPILAKILPSIAILLHATFRGRTRTQLIEDKLTRMSNNVMKFIGITPDED